MNACTDVTGFGLLGHLAEMVGGSGRSVRIYADPNPGVGRCPDLCGHGVDTAGAYRNREFRVAMIEMAERWPGSNKISFSIPRLRVGC